MKSLIQQIKEEEFASLMTKEIASTSMLCTFVTVRKRQRAIKIQIHCVIICLTWIGQTFVLLKKFVKVRLVFVVGADMAH